MGVLPPRPQVAQKGKKYSMIKLRQTPPRISETTVWNGMKIKPQVEETFARLIAKFGHQRLHGFGGMHG